MAPNKQQIAEVFEHLAKADADGFFQHVDSNVDVFVSPPSHHGIASF
jgi:hypothetical protein